MKSIEYQQSSPVPFKHELDVIAAPTNAHVTDNHKEMQLKRPLFPSRTVFKTVAPIAQRGAKTQKIISWALNETFHQQTKTIPTFRFAAAMIQPRQNAQTFLDIQVNQLNSSLFPNQFQNIKPETTSPIKKRAQRYTAVGDPSTNTQIQIISKEFVIAKWT